MAIDCIKEVLDAVDEDYKDAIKSGLFKRSELEAIAEDLKSLEDKYGGNLTPEQVNSVLKAMIETQDKELVIKLRARLIDLRKLNFVIDSIQNMVKEKNISLVEAYEAFMTGSSRDLRGAGNSVDAHIKTIVNTQIGILDIRFKKVPGLFEKISEGDENFDIAFYDELFAMTEKNRPTESVTGNKLAKQAADIVDDINRDLIARANAAGAYIRYRNSYTTEVHHNIDKMKRAGKEEWISSIKEHLNVEAMEKSPEILTRVDDWLGKMYDDITIGRLDFYNKGLDFDTILGGRKTASKMSEARKLIWKSGKDMYEYNKKFGRLNLKEVLFHGIEQKAKKIGLMERFGPNPENTYKKIIDFMLSKAENDNKLKSQLTTANLRMLDNRFKELTQVINIPVDKILSKVATNTRGLQVSSKLLSTAIRAIGERAIISTELMYQGFGFAESVWLPVSNVFKGLSKGAQREAATVLGAYSEGVLGHLHSRIAATDGAKGLASGLAEKTMRWSGLAWITETDKAGLVNSMTHHLGRNAKSEWKNLSRNLRRVLSRNEFNESKWNILRKYVTKADDGRLHLTPDLVENITDDEIRQMMRSDGRDIYKRIARDEISDFHVKEYRKTFEDDFSSYFTDRMNIGVITPGAKEFAIMRQGTEAGTVGGEILRAILQFRSFSITFTTKVLGREIYGRSGIMESAAGLAKLMLLMTAWGIITDGCSDIVNGRIPAAKYFMTNDWKQNGKIFYRAFMNSGAAGIYGDFLRGLVDDYGKGYVSTIVGPVFGSTVEEGAKIFTDSVAWMFGDAAGKTVGKDAARFMKHNTPLVNLWYSKWAFDYLYYHYLMEAIDPGYKDRLDLRIERETGQETIPNYIRRYH